MGHDGALAQNEEVTDAAELDSDALFPRAAQEETHRHAVAFVATAIAKEMRLSSREIGSLISAAFHQDAERSQNLDVARIANLRNWPWQHGEGLTDEEGSVPPAAHIFYFANCLEAALDPQAPTNEQKDQLFSQITNRIGSHFHPEVYAAFACAARNETFWDELMEILKSDPNDKKKRSAIQVGR